MFNILISESKFSITESQRVTELFMNGLQFFHVRKSKLSNRQMKKYIESIPSEFHSRLVLHSHHLLALKYTVRGIHLTRKHKNSSWYRWGILRYLLWRKPTLSLSTSFHHVADLKIFDLPYNYVFLSPVFDSISKRGYMASFTDSQISVGLANSKYKVIALGGINPDRVEKARDLGFNGVATVGYVWDSEDALAQFIKLKNAIDHQSVETTFGVVKPIKVSFSKERS